MTPVISVRTVSSGEYSMQILEYLKDNYLILDGGLGTLLQERGLKPGEVPERWNITHSDVIVEIHKKYYDAGSNVVFANTFGANTLKFSEEELGEIIKAALDNAKVARDMSDNKGEKFIALDIGPSGKLLKPYGDFEFEEAVSLFKKTVTLGEEYGADLIFIETMTDSYETKAALLAAKEVSRLPVFVSNAYGEDGKLMTGANPEAMAAMLESMGADAIGVNCSLGPEQLKDVVETLLRVSSVPIIFKPNAGLPKSCDGKTVFDISPEEFSETVLRLAEEGVRAVGGCCGTTPEYIELLSKGLKGKKPKSITHKDITCVSSYTHSVCFSEQPILIGERINPTGKKRFKRALIDNDIDYILKEGISQQEKGVHILDVNVGLPDIDEPKMLKTAVCELQAVTNLPLQIDTSDAVAMEAALRCYNGKALVNSVNGKQESMRTVFPLVKKYGGAVIALTLDENGIPVTAEGRVEIAKKILAVAKEYGIDKKDIIFDTLALTVSADNSAAIATLKALRIIREELGCHTSLGVSNVSFGLPSREAANSTFFALALENGLSAAIMNPYSTDMLKTYYAFRALHGLDGNCAEYIEFFSNLKEDITAASTVSAKAPGNNDTNINDTGLKSAIIKGFREQAAAETKELLKVKEPLDIVQEMIIPALDKVGKGFEEKTVYLPQLLISAEAAKNAFEEIKAFMSASEEKKQDKCVFVIATVHGDIHDIGKNIVKLLLENYGFAVIDLGKDVPPERIVDEVVKTHAPIAGLSALMTTTVPAMEETLKLLKKEAPWCKTVVGGAVLNYEYAMKIGADKYAKDAMETVRYAEKINSEL